MKLLSAYFIVYFFLLTNNMQSLSQTNEHLGLKGGISFSKQEWKDHGFKTEYLEGANFALYCDVLKVKDFSLLIEGGYVTKGFEFWLERHVGDSSSEENFGNMFHYLIATTAIKYEHNLQKVKPYGYIGPVFYYELDKKLRLLTLNNDPTNKFIFGACIAGGIRVHQFPVGGALLAEIRFNKDITQLYKHEKNISATQIDFRIGWEFK